MLLLLQAVKDLHRHVQVANMLRYRHQSQQHRFLNRLNIVSDCSWCDYKMSLTPRQQRVTVPTFLLNTW
jgi:hypothetical protein